LIKNFLRKTTAVLTAVFFIFIGIPLPFSFAIENELTLNETQQFVPTLTLEQANAQQAPVTQNEIPSGVAVQNENPLSLTAQDLPAEGDPVPEGAIQVHEGESIQSAIDQAQAGDTIYVHAGTYHESISLKDGIDLVGQNEETTILHGDYVSGNSAIRAFGNNTIEHLTITGARDGQGQITAGIRIEGDHVTVRDNKVLFNLSAGVYVQADVMNVLIEGNLFHGNSIAIKEPKSRNTIAFNTIVGYETEENIRIKGLRYFPGSGFQLEIQNPQGAYSYYIEYSNDYGKTWIRAQVQDPPAVFKDQLVLANTSGNTLWMDDGSTTSPGPFEVDVRWYRVKMAESFVSKIGIQMLGNQSPVIRKNIIAHQTVQSIWEEAATPFYGNAEVENNILFHNNEKGDASGPHLPPQISGWLSGNVLADPQFTDSVHGDYTVPEASPAFYRGAFVPAVLRFAFDRADGVHRQSGATYTFEKILSGGQLTGWRFVYSDGSVETFDADGTKHLDTTPPTIVILSTTVLTKDFSYQLVYTVDGVQQTETRTLTEGANTLTVSASDIFGNYATASLNVMLDASASDFTWVHGGAGAGLWSVAANWLGGHVPGLNDIAVFGSYALSNCLIDTAVSVSGITIASGFTGTITQQANVSVANNFSQAGGQWLDEDPAAHTFTVGNNFSISQAAGAFNRYGAQVSGAYQVRDVYDLQAMKGFLAGNFELAGNIDASSTANWNSGAGFNSVGSITTPFTGVFDGASHTISGLKINRPTEDYVALFGYTGGSFGISNVGLLDVNITGYRHVGGLAGRSGSSITNSYTTGSVTGRATVGGLAGSNNAIISNSFSTATVISTGPSYASSAGGLAGSNSGAITNSHAAGAVSGTERIGGLVGSNAGTVTDSYAAGIINGMARYTGGLVGYSNGSGAIISRSYATGAVTGASYVGGLVGFNYSRSSITNSYATGTVTGTAGDNSAITAAGGLVGANEYYSTILNSYSTGAVRGIKRVGGLAGFNWDHATITNSFTTSDVTGTYEIGGLTGCPYCTGTESNSYYTDNPPNNNGKGTYEPGGAGAFYGSSHAVYDQAGVNPWNFATVWDSYNYSLPHLKWENFTGLPSIELVLPVITQIPSVANQWTLKFDQAMRGVRYEIQYDAGSGVFQTAGTFIADSYGEVSWQDPAQDRGLVVYRAVPKEITTATDFLTQINLLYFDPAFGLVEPTHEYPAEGWASRDFTQPSNFGFYAYLLATIAAGDLVTASISKAEAIRRLNVLVDNLLADQRDPQIGYKGLLPWMSYNGTDWGRMNDAYGQQVAFEDNSNLTNALGVAYGALLDDSLSSNVTVHGTGGNDQGILGKIDDFIAAQEEGYRAMYDEGARTFSRAMSVVDGSVYGGTIDYFGAESQGPLLFLILQYGNAFSAEAYSKLHFTAATYSATGQRVPAPFTGAFHLYWPALLMPESQDPDLRGMLEAYTDIQLDYASRNGHPGLLSAAYDVYPENLLSRSVSAFSWMGDVVTGNLEIGGFHVTSPTNAGIGIAITDGSKFTFEGSEMKLRYSSMTAVPNAKIEFKKMVNGALTIVHTEYLSLENTGGAEKSVTVSLPLNGDLGGLKEVVLATSGGSALDLTILGFDTDRILYNFPLGIREIAWNQWECVEATPSVYNLGAAYMFRPEQTEALLQGLIAGHPDLVSAHGLWEGKNMVSGKVVNEQVFNNVTTFVLGMTGTGPSYITRYLENKNLTAELESIWNSQAPVSVTGQGVPTDFQWDVYKGTSWKLNESVRASDRQIRITYQSDTAITGAKFDLKYSTSGSDPVYSILFDLPATGGVPGEVILTIPESILYWYISEMVVVFPAARGFPSATIDRMVLAPEGVVMPPQVMFDAGTPVLIKTKSLTVNYTVDGAPRTKLFENLLEGANTLTITAADVPGLVTPVTWNVTVDTIAPVIVLDPGTPSMITTTSLTVFYTVDGAARQKVFNGLVAGMNTLTITETDPAENQTMVNFNVLSDPAAHDFLKDRLDLILFDGGTGSLTWGIDHLRLSCLNCHGFGFAAIAPGIDVVGKQMQFRYVSGIFNSTAKIEFKKKDEFGVLRVVGTRYFDIEDTNGEIRTVDLGVIPPGIPNDLDEVAFVVYGDGGLFVMEVHDFLLYTPAPAEPTVIAQINNNATYTNSETILVTLNATNFVSPISLMRFSTNNGESWAPWQEYSNIACSLPSGDGVKTILVQVRDVLGNEFSTSDTIILETVSPTGSIMINHGDAKTVSPDVTLQLTGSDATSGVDTMRFFVNGGTDWTPWETFATTKSLSLLGTGGTGTKEIQYQVQDRAGNVSTYSDTIDYDLEVPAGASVVSVVAGDRRLFVQNMNRNGTLEPTVAFVARGVNWSPTSQSSYPDGDDLTFRKEFVKWYETDIPLMAQMGVNVVRVYHDFGTGPDAIKILDMLYHYGIKVIMTVDSPLSRSRADLDNISLVVNAYKNHPAILMWSIGNEWDLNRYYQKYATFEEAAAFTEQAAQLIQGLDTSHPVTTVVGDSWNAKVAASSLVPSVDVWGINIYREQSFGEAINQWEAVSNKPFYIGEYGADSYDHRIGDEGAENQAMQAQMTGHLWDEAYFDLSAERTEGALIGALAFEWNDEWWKGGSPGAQLPSGESNVGQPDGHNDEEWFGIVDIDRNVKQAYAAMQGRFLDLPGSVQTNATPLVTVISQEDTYRGSVRFKLEDGTFSYREGEERGYSGITIAVVDGNTGIRLSDVKTFKTPESTYNGTGTFLETLAMIDYINSLPDGTAFALSVADEAGFTNESGISWNHPAVTEAYELFEMLGSEKVHDVKYHYGWAMIVVKGQGVLAEGISAPPVVPSDSVRRTPVTVSARLTTPLPLNPDAGRRPADMSVASQIPLTDPIVATDRVPQKVSLPAASSVVGGKQPLKYAAANLWGDQARKQSTKVEKGDALLMPKATISAMDVESRILLAKGRKKVASRERFVFRSETSKRNMISALAGSR
jgi:hypothetical protein